MMITSKKQAEEVGVENLDKVGCAGTGPWVYDSSTTQYWKFKANKDYWGKVPNFEELVFWHVPEEATRVSQFQTGQLDIIQAGTDSLNVLQQNPETQIMVTGAAADLHLGMYGNWYVKDWPGYDPSLPWVSSDPDPNSEPWKKAAMVRRAMAISIDREAIVENLLGGAGEPTHLWGWYMSRDELPASNHWTYDPDEARRLLVEAGYPNGFDVLLEQRVSGTPAEIQACQAIGTMWSNIGLRVEYENQPNDAILPLLSSRTFNGILCQGQGATPEPINQYQSWVPSTNSFSGGIEHAILDDLIAKAGAELDYDKRMDIEREIADFTFQNALDIGVYAAEIRWPLGPKVGDWSDNWAFIDGRLLANLQYAPHRTN
jgi:peptide/nickel transport system substrate-binding protein